MSMEPYRSAGLADVSADEQYARAEIAPDVPRGETVLWAGTPRQGVRLRASDALGIPFSLLWTGFAVFWEISVIKTGAPLFFCFWGVPFVAVGLYLLVGRFFYEAWLRSRTVYAVTNRHVLIVESTRRRTVRTRALAMLPEVHHQLHGDGSGPLTLGDPPDLMIAVDQSSRRSATRRFELVGIARSREVLETLREAQNALRAGDGESAGRFGQGS